MNKKKAIRAKESINRAISRVKKEWDQADLIPNIKKQIKRKGELLKRFDSLLDSLENP